MKHLPKSILTSAPLLPLLLYIFSASLSAQDRPISQQLGGVVTQYRITSGPHVLNDGQQLLIKRSNYLTGSDRAGGYSEFHFEFAANQLPIGMSARQTANWPRMILTNPRGRRFMLTFFDREERVLHRTFFGHHRISVSSPQEDDGASYFFSIDLRNIPILLLDQTGRIDLQWQPGM
jgi:hypothetical protein